MPTGTDFEFEIFILFFFAQLTNPGTVTLTSTAVFEERIIMSETTKILLAIYFFPYSHIILCYKPTHLNIFAETSLRLMHIIKCGLLRK